MTSPRKFAEKIALLQQKQVEGDAAFNNILCEVEAAKQKTDRPSATKSDLDVPKMSNGMNHYGHQFVKTDNTNGFDRLSLPLDDSPWRRTYSDSSLHQPMNPTMIAHYHPQHINDNQQLHFDTNEQNFESPSYSPHPPAPVAAQFQVNHSPYATLHPYDVNNNNCINGQNNVLYTPMLQQSLANSISYPPPTFSTTRSNGGNSNPNVLMLPPNPYSRNGGSLPDLRLESVYNTNEQTSPYSTLSSPSPTASLHGFRSPSPHENGVGDLFLLEPQQQQQQLTSSVGPLKSSANMRRRHSPMAKGRPSSSRRHSPAPDVSPSQSNIAHRVEPQSPQSQSSYSPQNSPHYLPSPLSEHSPFSPQQQTGTDNHQTHYFALSNHFDQIKLDNNYYPQQSPTHSSLPTTPAGTTDFRQRNFGSSVNEDLSSTFVHRSPTIGVKSPTIPDIILTDADNSKSDPSKDFVNLLDGCSFDLPLNADDLLLNPDLSMDQMFGDDAFQTES